MEGKHCDITSFGVHDEAARRDTTLVMAGSKHASGCARRVACSTSAISAGACIEEDTAALDKLLGKDDKPEKHNGDKQQGQGLVNAHLLMIVEG